jgi:glycosyltransferase involved in cell wall biosynthesis
MISVIIPTYRNPKYLDLCLHSLVTGQYNCNEIIVVVDGYAEESESVLAKYKGISVINLPTNQGMQAAINIGAWKSTSDKLLIINDDNVFPVNWDTRIEAQYHPNTIMTVNQIEPTGPGMFNFPVVDCGQTVETFAMETFLAAEKELSTNMITKDGNIFPFLINKKWFMAVGGFDTWYNSPNICDWDFALKLQLIPTIGYARIHHVHLYHFGSVATKKNAESARFQEREHNAMLQYRYKWGYGPYNGENNTKLPPEGLTYYQPTI